MGGREKGPHRALRQLALNHLVASLNDGFNDGVVRKILTMNGHETTRKIDVHALGARNLVHLGLNSLHAVLAGHALDLVILSH